MGAAWYPVPESNPEAIEGGNWAAKRNAGRNAKRKFLRRPLPALVLATIPVGRGRRISIADLADTIFTCDGFVATTEGVRDVLVEARRLGFAVDLTPQRYAARAAWSAHDRGLIAEAFDRRVEE